MTDLSDDQTDNENNDIWSPPNNLIGPILDALNSPLTPDLLLRAPIDTAGNPNYGAMARQLMTLAGFQAPSSLISESQPIATSSPDAIISTDGTSLQGSDPIQLIGHGGTPGNNSAQNAQVKAVVRILGLNRDQRDELHRRISKQGMGWDEIMQEGLDILGQ